MKEQEVKISFHGGIIVARLHSHDSDSDEPDRMLASKTAQESDLDKVMKDVEEMVKVCCSLEKLQS